MSGWIRCLPLLFLCAGCSTLPEQPDPTAAAVTPELATTLLADASLGDALRIREQSAIRDANGVFLAQTRILNRWNTPLDVELRCIFKNELGQTLEASPWKAFTINGGELLTYTSPSINVFTDRFMVLIRLKNPSNIPGTP